MNKVPQQHKKSYKKYFMALFIIATVLITCSIWLASNKPFETYPLDDNLEYVGSSKYGCYVFCDSSPAATYYYATDLNVDEIITHFSKTTLEKEPSTVDGKTYFGVRANANETIYFYYYDNPESVKDEGLKKTDKRHILSLPSFKYNLAKESL